MKKVIGIDLGGTSIYGGLINENGEILKRSERDTEAQKGRKEVLKRIGEVINELMVGETIEGIGLGSPGFIDAEQGKVLFLGGNIAEWTGLNLKEELSKEFPEIPIFVENDANVAAICEEWTGGAKGLNNFVMLTLGTGVGGAIYTKKEGIWHGTNYQGAELGHSILYPNGKLCGCGQKGCVEQYISGNAVEKSYFEMTKEKKRGKEIFKNSLENDICKEVVDNFAKDVAICLVSIRNIFDPQGVVIGGGVINSKEYWWDKMLAYYKDYCNNPDGMDILPAVYLNDAGMIGAAKVAFDRI
ncbi:ROK family protein [Tissierella sp. MSJ-40]|uniref:ROK family protein n=1 Tax=Tissierella simiarum TaxID=2841534 RepID=A0ABS6E3C2_9FIRM|nr:ROK family protein [Tissierella simiarum]MBU5437398.1 ROK family protein [Tissierella simiarum]